MMKKLKLRTNIYSGKLIAFEGTDGAGKSTLVNLLGQYLKSEGQEVLIVKQPTDSSRKTKLFQKMMYCENHDDIDYRAVQLLTMSDRVQHSFEVIEPALKAGQTVICDRYLYTSLANMLARGYVKEKWFYEVAKHIIKPNKTFLVYVDPQLAIKRILNRPDEVNRYLDRILLKNVATQFLDMARREKFIVLDGECNPEDTFKIIKMNLEKI